MKKTLILVLAVLVLSGCAKSENKESLLNQDSAKNVAVEFINDKLLTPGSKQTATITDIKEENGLYKMAVNVGGKEIDSYMTKDGKKFFPQAIDIVAADTTKEIADKKEQNPASVKVDKKSDKPVVDLFVMARCPYGTQIEKGILPVAELLGNKIDFNVKFCDYSMHGKDEIDDQLIQYCIEKDNPDKFVNYLKCFLEKKDNSEQCIKDNGLNKTKIDSCVANSDKKFKITEDYNNKETWKGNFPSFNIYKDDNIKYGIKGSPGLVINGENMRTGRSSAELLDVICSAFNNKPKECDTELSSETPLPGFGKGVSNSKSDGGCAN